MIIDRQSGPDKHTQEGEYVFRHQSLHFGSRHVLEAGQAQVFKGGAAAILTPPLLGWV
jgi:hypothetical protein